MKEGDNVGDPEGEAEGDHTGLLDEEDHKDRRVGRGGQYFNFLPVYAVIAIVVVFNFRLLILVLNVLIVELFLMKNL